MAINPICVLIVFHALERLKDMVVGFCVEFNEKHYVILLLLVSIDTSLVQSVDEKLSRLFFRPTMSSASLTTLSLHLIFITAILVVDVVEGQSLILHMFLKMCHKSKQN